MSPWLWVGVPLLGGAIGWLTNRLAVRMIFRPVRPVNVLGLRVQGLIGRRQEALATRIGAVVGDHLLRHEDLVRSFENLDGRALVSGILTDALAPKIGQLRQLPIVGGLLTEERVAEIREAVVDGVMSRREVALAQVERVLEEELDVAQLVTDRVAAFPVEKLEELVLEVADRELRSIEVLGGVIGLAIGVLQVVLIEVIGR